MTRAALLITLAVCIACNPTSQTPAVKKTPAGPTIRATVITIRTTQQPENRILTQTIVIAGDRARDTSERDMWRLFDTKEKTVAFVDDVARTVRTEPLQKLIDQRRAEFSKALPAHYPRVRVLEPGTTRQLLGVQTELHTIETGVYKRELWIGEHPSIPRGLFAMMHASDPPTLPLAPIMRAVDEVLMATRGFPLLDRATVPVAKDELVVERVVLSVTTKDVPQALFEIPRGYSSSTAMPQVDGSNVNSRSVKPLANSASAQSSSTSSGQ